MFDQRLREVKQLLQKEKLDGIFVSSVSNIIYLTGFSSFSKDEREVYLLIGKDFQYVITDGRYSEAVKKNIPHLKLFEKGYKKSTEDLFKKHKKDINILGIEEGNLTVGEFKIIKKHFKKLKHLEVGYLRSIKNKEEIDKIKKACDLGDKAFNYILTKIKTGITEKEIAYNLERFIREKGAENSFPIIVAFDKNSSVPHHQTGDTELKSGDIVLIDMGVKIDNYCSDMTRTIFFGKPSQKQKEIYNVVLSAQKKALEFLNKQIKIDKKVKASEVDKVARDYIKSKGFPDIPHSLGHGIGLEVHEHPSLSPKSKEILEEGMVFSIEPGIYIEDFGGVRIEDLYTIKNGKLLQFTNSPKELTKV